MWKEREKYINKSRYKKELLKVVEDILDDNISVYDAIKMQWYKDCFRIRKGKMRIVFKKNDWKNEIVAVQARGNIYKWLKNL